MPFWLMVPSFKQLGSKKYLAGCFFICLLVTLDGASQQADEVHVAPRDQAATRTAANETPRFTSTANLVLLPLTVTDPAARIVTGLKKENFQVFENGKPEEIHYFYTQDAPVSVGIIVDVSGSMGVAANASRDAVVEFMRTANPEDEFFLMCFAEKPEMLKELTTDVESLQTALVYSPPTRGETALVDALYFGLKKMRHTKYERKALLVITDGGENYSRYKFREVRRIIAESDVEMFLVGVPGRDYASSMLRAIADSTGGRVYRGIDRDTASKVSADLRNEYVIGYYPKNLVHDGKWRSVRVKLQVPAGSPKLHISGKSGYYGPDE